MSDIWKFNSIHQQKQASKLTLYLCGSTSSTNEVHHMVPVLQATPNFTDCSILVTKAEALLRNLLVVPFPSSWSNNRQVIRTTGLKLDNKQANAHNWSYIWFLLSGTRNVRHYIVTRSQCFEYYNCSHLGCAGASWSRLSDRMLGLPLAPRFENVTLYGGNRTS